MSKDKGVSNKGSDGSLEDIRDAVARLSRAQHRAKKVLDKPEIAQSPSADVPVEVEVAIHGSAPRRSQTDNQAKEQISPDVLHDALRRAEAVLFASDRPVTAEDLAQALPPGADVGEVLMQLQKDFQNRGVQLVEIAGAWRFQTASDLAFLFEEVREEERKLSKAALETLAIIAYCQPVSRAEIEDVRGVAVSKGTLDVLMEQKWVRIRGRRRTPGRPVVYGTTDVFLEHFGLESIEAMPGRDDMKAAGLLSSNIPADFDMPVPSDSEADEELIETEDASDDAAFHVDFMDGGEKSE